MFNSKYVRGAAAMAIGATILTVFVAGCDENNRQPTTAEIKAADQKRQSYVDSMNLPPQVKAQMKAHMGGPPVANPADAAKAAAGQKSKTEAGRN